MYYKVVVIPKGRNEIVIYEGLDKQIADDAFAVAYEYTRKYYVGTISWEQTKHLVWY